VFAPVAPTIKGQYSEEVVAASQYDVGLDICSRQLHPPRPRRVIEDLSPDGGHTYFISNRATASTRARSTI